MRKDEGHRRGSGPRLGAKGAAVKRYWWIPLGILLVIVGATKMWPLEETQSYGVSSYGPIDQAAIEATLEAEREARFHSSVVGSVALIVGLMVLAGGTAFLLGRRRSARGSDPGASSSSTRALWWLPVGLALGILGGFLIWSVDSAMTGSGPWPCSDVEPGQTCHDFDTLARNWFLGALLVIAGLLTIASGIGYRWGRRGNRERLHDLVAT